MTIKGRTYHPYNAKEMGSPYGKSRGYSTFLRIIRSFPLPLSVLCSKFSHTRFEPSGWTGNPQIGYAKSLMDYIFRYLALKFPPPTSPPPTGAEVMAPAPAHLEADAPGEEQTYAPACKDCGAIMTRNGSCYHCATCGSTSGCS